MITHSGHAVGNPSRLGARLDPNTQSARSEVGSRVRQRSVWPKLQGLRQANITANSKSRSARRYDHILRLAAQHLPVLVTGDQRDVFDGKAGLEEAACAFAVQVVEMQVLQVDLHGGMPESGIDRSRTVGKVPTICAPQFLGLSGGR